MTLTPGSRPSSAKSSSSCSSGGDDDDIGVQKSVTPSEDFLCGCCFDLMVQPTTLTCGHSFCRLCIANWYLASRKLECPQCRSAWTGNPQINITLRNLLNKMNPDAESREQEILTAEACAKIAKFDSALSDKKETDSSRATGQGFCGGICFAVAIVTVVYLSWCWRSSDQDLLVHKSLSKWTVDDVDQWFTDMGSWTQNYVKVVRDRQISGNLMLGLDEEMIMSTFNVTDPLHQRALNNAINLVQLNGVKAPSNLWEFKSVYPGWALFLLYGMKDFPRTSMLYLYWFEHETMFLPFVHIVCPVEEQMPKYDFSHIPPPLTSVQWAEFLPKIVFLPYLLIGEFTWDWIDIHYWTSRFILASCVAMTTWEANYIAMFLRREDRMRVVKESIKKLLKSYVSLGMFVLIWPLVPSFVCDCFFYVALYFSPYQISESIYTMWRR